MIGALIEAGRAIVGCAERHRDSLMPDYTYLQASQPTTFAHFLLGFGCALMRDLDRARALFGRINLSPAGCGSSNGSILPQDRERLAALLGFDGLIRHARDAMWEADLPIEALGVATAALVNLDRLAEDLMIFSTAEFGFVELADAHARTSKIMPQKKNPFALGYIRAVANKLIGVQTAMAVCGRTPTGQMDNRLQPNGDVPDALGTAAGAAKLMGESIVGLTFDHSRARHALDSSFACATDLAELIMTKAGVDFRTAHRLIARLTRDMIDRGARSFRIANGDLDAVASAMIGRPLGLSQQQLDEAADPARRRISPHRNRWSGSRSRKRHDRRMPRRSRGPCAMANRRRRAGSRQAKRHCLHWRSAWQRATEWLRSSWTRASTAGPGARRSFAPSSRRKRASRSGWKSWRCSLRPKGSLVLFLQIWPHASLPAAARSSRIRVFWMRSGRVLKRAVIRLRA